MYAVFIFFSIVFCLLHGFFWTTYARKLLQSKRIFWMMAIGLLVIQIAAVIAIRFEVGDITLNAKAGYFFRYGADFYTIDADHSQYPFFPFLIFLHALLSGISERFPQLLFSSYLKFILIACVQFIAVCLYRYHRKKDVLLAKILCMQFVSSPLLYFVVLFHGQVDVMLISFFIAALLMLTQADLLPEVFLAGIVYACSVATKTWSVVFIPMILRFFGLGKTIIVVVTTIAFLLFIILIYQRLAFNAKIATILIAVTKPGGPVGIWGISFFAKYNLYVFAVLFVLFQILLWCRKYTLWHYAFLTILSLFIIVPNWGVQYIFWIVPFLYFAYPHVSKTWIFIFTAYASIYLFSNYTWILIENPPMLKVINPYIGIVLWVLCIGWFGSNMIARNENRK